jgi:polysaccharide pyruvyl transferase WcaK-like protein
VISRTLDALRRTTGFLQGNYFQSRQPLAYVGGWLGQQNLGDEALLFATQRLFPEHNLWHFDGSRAHQKLIDVLRPDSAGLFAGGTLVNRAPEYLDISRAFLTERRRLFFFGAGVADPSFWTGRGDFRDMLPEWSELLNRCGYVGVRGPLSARLLSDAGVSNVQIVGDPVIAYAADTPAPPPVPQSLGLNVGFDHGHQWGDSRSFQSQVLNLAKLAKAAGWSVKWFVVFPKDLAITRQLAAESGTATNIFCSYDNVERYLDEARTVSTFAGMKLHATMLALCAFVPSLMLAYTPKGGDFMDSIGQGSSCFRTDQFNAEVAWEMLKSWDAERAARSELIRAAVLNLRNHQRDEAHALAQIIKAA